MKASLPLKAIMLSSTERNWVGVYAVLKLGRSRFRSGLILYSLSKPGAPLHGCVAELLRCKNLKISSNLLLDIKELKLSLLNGQLLLQYDL